MADHEDTEEYADIIAAVEQIKTSGRKLMQCLTLEDGDRDKLVTFTTEMGQDLKHFVTLVDKFREGAEKEEQEEDEGPKEVDLKGLVALNNEVRIVLIKLNGDYREMLKDDCEAGWTQLRELVKKILQLGETAKIPIIEQIRESFGNLNDSIQQPPNTWASSADIFSDRIKEFFSALKEIQNTFKREKIKTQRSQPANSRSQYALARQKSVAGFENELKELNISKLDPSKLFKFEKMIGRGEGGEVWKATKVGGGQVLAIKKVLLQFKTLNATSREIATMSKIKHQNTLKYYNCYKHENSIWIVMEFCDLGSIQDILLKKGKGLDEEFIVNITEQVLQGLSYLHSKSFLHRDIKAGNLLMKQSGRVKIADFGTSASAMYLRTTVIGSSYWMAPETIDSSGHDSKADIWSFGCTLLEMAERDPPFFNVPAHLVGGSILSSPAPTFSEPQKWSKPFQSFLSFCLRKNPKERKAAIELIQEPWIVQRDPKALSIFVKDPVNAKYDASAVGDLPADDSPAPSSEPTSTHTSQHKKPSRTTKTKTPSSDEGNDQTMKIFLQDLRSGKRIPVTAEETVSQVISKCKREFRKAISEADGKKTFGLFFVSPKGEIQLNDESGTPWQLLCRAKKGSKRADFKFVYKPIG
eukprot:TRINITY_DN3805_c0_g1_i1.p1 TRINITY_DN3805_c0_g1~~TRINITY_DN3805_c0_g1_i1.p1  ORF type:complete len:698 (-),score=154.94 TRINITY_DN3805_c0_g1_i1:91-2010(-)